MHYKTLTMSADKVIDFEEFSWDDWKLVKERHIDEDGDGEWHEVYEYIGPIANDIKLEMCYYTESDEACFDFFIKEDDEDELIDGGFSWDDARNEIAQTYQIKN